MSEGAAERSAPTGLHCRHDEHCPRCFPLFAFMPRAPTPSLHSHACHAVSVATRGAHHGAAWEHGPALAAGSACGGAAQWHGRPQHDHHTVAFSCMAATEASRACACTAIATMVMKCSHAERGQALRVGAAGRTVVLCTQRQAWQAGAALGLGLPGLRLPSSRWINMISQAIA